VTDVPSVTALSRIGLQVFGHSHGRWFTHVPEQTAQLQTKHFALLPPWNFLLLLRHPAETNRTQLAEVSSEDIKEFNMMTAQKQATEMALLKYEEE